ncbi:MAG: hypothetical protein ACFB16_03095 [Phormidesmis sp.]
MKTVLKAGGSVLGACGVAGLWVGPAIAGLEDTRLLSRNANGSFLAICVNGETETVTTFDIRQNSVCDGDTQGSEPDGEPVASTFTCTGSEFSDRFYITRIDNDERLGDVVSLATCRQLIADANEALICTGSEFSDRFYITKIEDGERLGENLQMSTCRQLVKEQEGDFICAGSEFSDRFYMTRISSGQRFGEVLSLATCQQMINDIRPFPDSI